MGFIDLGLFSWRCTQSSFIGARRYARILELVGRNFDSGVILVSYFQDSKEVDARDNQSGNWDTPKCLSSVFSRFIVWDFIVCFLRPQRFWFTGLHDAFSFCISVVLSGLQIGILTGICFGFGIHLWWGASDLDWLHTYFGSCGDSQADKASINFCMEPT